MPLCFLMCLLVHVRPAVVCDIVLLSALFVFKSLVSPILTKIDSLYVVEIDHFGLKKIYPVYLFWLLLHNIIFFQLINLPSWLLFPFWLLLSCSFLFKELSISLFLLPSLRQHLWEEKPIAGGSGINAPFRARLDPSPISLSIRWERGSLSLVALSLSSF